MDRVVHMPSAPQWFFREITIDGYRSADPIVLFYRNSAECVQYLLKNTLFAKHIQFVPVEHYSANGSRIFREAVSARQAWQTQVRLLERRDSSLTDLCRNVYPQEPHGLVLYLPRMQLC